MSTVVARTDRPTLDGERAALVAFGQAHPAVLRLRVFGSVARGDANPASDVDIAVDFVPGSVPRGLAGFASLDELEARLSVELNRAVNLVAGDPLRAGRRPATHPLQKAIQRDGRVLYEAEDVPVLLSSLKSILEKEKSDAPGTPPHDASAPVSDPPEQTE